MSADAGARLMPMVDPEIESAPWEEQARLRRAALSPADRLSVRALALLSRQARARGLRDARRGRRPRRRSPALPLTEKDELRATRTPDEPIGAHLTARPDEIVRIYSTSGTTGTPSYIPLDRRATSTSGCALRRAATRPPASRAASASSRPTTPARSSPAPRSPLSTRLGLCHIPVGTGNTERLMAAVELLKPTVVVMTPSYALHLAEWARERGIDLADSSVKRVLVAGEPGGGEPAMRAKLEAAWGASVTEAMGIGDISVSLWGECEEKAGHAFQRPRLRPFRADRSGDRRGEADRRRRRRRARADPSRQPLGAAAALPHPRPCAARLRPLRLRAHDARACAASAAPTTC